MLISGAGTAGLTCAYWLHRHGHTPVVVERASHGRLGGYGFDFHGTGYELAERMGIIENLEPFRIPVNAVVYVNRRGAITARLSTDLIRHIIRGPYMALMHTGLEDALTAAVRDNVEIRYAHQIAAIDQRPENVRVAFADGTEETYDLVVGADGIHSVTRELVFGPEHRFARYLGYYIASYPVPDRYDVGTVRAHYTEPGRQTITYPTEQPGERMALYLFAAPDTGEVPRAERLDRLRSAFARMAWITPQLLADAPESEQIFMDTMTQIEMPHWHRGRVALIGDACGCMTLVSAQGVSMAMAGGYVLADALRTHGDHRAAFRHYQERLHPEVSYRQRNARSFARMLAPRTRLGIAASTLLTRLLLRQAFAGILRRRFTSSGILHDESR